MDEETGENNQSIWSELTKTRDQLTGCGLILTIGWFSTVGFLFWLNGYSFYKFSGNELGGFLAGSVAPVGFFWLVIGYFQQGKELKISSQALIAQEQELTNQTQQLTEQASLLNKDIKLRLAEATPRLAFRQIRNSRANHDTTCKDIFFYNYGGKVLGIKSKSYLERVATNVCDKGGGTSNQIITGEEVYLRVVHKDADSSFSVEITYQDVFGKLYRHDCIFSNSELDWSNFFENPVEVKEPIETEEV